MNHEPFIYDQPIDEKHHQGLFYSLEADKTQKVRDLLEEEEYFTVSGPYSSGKTSLIVHVARAISGYQKDIVLDRYFQDTNSREIDLLNRFISICEKLLYPVGIEITSSINDIDDNARRLLQKVGSSNDGLVIKKTKLLEWVEIEQKRIGQYRFLMLRQSDFTTIRRYLKDNLRLNVEVINYPFNIYYDIGSHEKGLDAKSIKELLSKMAKDLYNLDDIPKIDNSIQNFDRKQRLCLAYHTKLDDDDVVFRGKLKDWIDEEEDVLRKHVFVFLTTIKSENDISNYLIKLFKKKNIPFIEERRTSRVPVNKEAGRLIRVTSLSLMEAINCINGEHPKIYNNLYRQPLWDKLAKNKPQEVIVAQAGTLAGTLQMVVCALDRFLQPKDVTDTSRNITNASTDNQAKQAVSGDVGATAITRSQDAQTTGTGDPAQISTFLKKKKSSLDHDELLEKALMHVPWKTHLNKWWASLPQEIAECADAVLSGSKSIGQLDKMQIEELIAYGVLVEQKRGKLPKTPKILELWRPSPSRTTSLMAMLFWICFAIVNLVCGFLSLLIGLQLSSSPDYFGKFGLKYILSLPTILGFGLLIIGTALIYSLRVEYINRYRGFCRTVSVAIFSIYLYFGYAYFDSFNNIMVITLIAKQSAAYSQLVGSLIFYFSVYFLAWNGGWLSKLPKISQPLPDIIKLLFPTILISYLVNQVTSESFSRYTWEECVGFSTVSGVVTLIALISLHIKEK